MRYEYTYRNTTSDFFKFYIGNVYSQWTGIIGVVFTGAMIALIVSRWGESGMIFRAVMVIGLLLFPVVQPLGLWLRSMKASESIKPETTLLFDEKGMGICVQLHSQRIPWGKNASVVKRPGLLVVTPDGMHLYLLPDRVTGEKKEELYAFLRDRAGCSSR